MIRLFSKSIPVILATLAVLACACAQADPPTRPGGPPERGRMHWGGKPGNWAPSLTDSERQQLKAMAMDTVRQTGKCLADIAKGRRSLRELYRSYKIDEGAYRSASEALDRAQYSLLKSNLDSQKKIRQILSRKSFDSLRDILGRFKGMPGMEGGFRGRDRLSGKWGAPKQPAQSEFHTATKPILDRIAANAKLLFGVYSKYDLDVKAAEDLIRKIHKDQMALTRLNHKQQQSLRSQLTEDQFNHGLRNPPAQSNERSLDF